MRERPISEMTGLPLSFRRELGHSVGLASNLSWTSRPLILKGVVLVN